MNCPASVALWRARQRSGWTWLLPDQPMRHLLCLDDGEGHAAAALAGHCQRLTLVIPTVPDGLVEHLEQQGCQVSLARSYDPLPADVDGVVLHLLSGNGATLTRSLPAILHKFGSRASARGFVFVLVDNALGYTRACRRGPTSTRTDVWGAVGVRRCFQRAGLKRPRVAPLSLDHGRVDELLLPRRPGTDLAGERLRARAKSWVLGTGLRQWIAPAFAAAAAPGRESPTRLEALLGHLVQREILSPDTKLVRVVNLPSKLVVSVDTPVGGRILMLPADAEAAAARQAEARLLRQLVQRAPALAGRVPRPCAVGDWHGRPYLLMNRFDGVCIDEPVPDLANLTDQALDFLCELHAVTAHREPLEGAGSGRLVDLFTRAATRHPQAGPFFERLQADLRELVSGQVLPLVWTHGDYKIENLVFGQRTRILNGVIDWEMSEPSGLPLLDLLYLLVYNRMLSGASFLKIFRDVVLQESWNEQERAWLRRYLQAVPLDVHLLPALEAMLLVHAAAVRFRFDLSDARGRRTFLEALACATARVSATLPAAARPTGTEG